MLKVDQLQKRYLEATVLHSVSFQVNPGEIVALVGANGAGKSTLLKAIMGLTEFRSGHITIGAEGYLPGTVSAKRIVSYVPEQPLLYNDLTAWEHLRYVAMIHAMPEVSFLERAEYLLRRLALWESRHFDPLEMSKGMMQKVSLAAALLTRPRLLLLDEPFSGLDPVVSRTLRALIVEASQEGAAVLMSTHLLDTAERFCHRFVLLYNGRLVGNADSNHLRRISGLAETASMDDVFAAFCDKAEEV
jgi:ABC-2 type transport system ATP-binding protein